MKDDYEKTRNDIDRLIKAIKDEDNSFDNNDSSLNLSKAIDNIEDDSDNVDVLDKFDKTKEFSIVRDSDSSIDDSEFDKTKELKKINKNVKETTNNNEKEYDKDINNSEKDNNEDISKIDSVSIVLLGVLIILIILIIVCFIVIYTM